MTDEKVNIKREDIKKNLLKKVLIRSKHPTLILPF